MKLAVRTTIDIPTPLYRKLKEEAARQGCSVGELINRGIGKVLLEKRRCEIRRVHFPLIRSKGPKVNLTSERIYKIVGFP